MRNNRKIEFNSFDRYVYIKQDWDHENDTQVMVMLEEGAIYFSFCHEDPDVGNEDFRFEYSDIAVARSLLSYRNYQIGKSLPDNPFDDFTSSATFSWEAAIDGIEIK